LIEAVIDAVRGCGSDVSIDQMAEVAGVSKPVLYAEFGDKMGVVDAVAVVLADRVERTVVDTVASAGILQLEPVIEAIVDAMMTLIDEEPQLYAFLVRGVRTSDRGLLDNALVRAFHQKSSAVVDLFAASVRKDELAVLTDGLFGFMVASVESWLAVRRPEKARLVHTLSVVIRAGLEEAASPR
jgi:AcrR family transcriptional regulator